MNPTVMHIIYAALLLLLIGPGLWARTRGHRLQYVALWLALFVALSWGYQIFAPENTRFDRRISEREAFYHGQQNSEEGRQFSEEERSDNPFTQRQSGSKPGDDI